MTSTIEVSELRLRHNLSLIERALAQASTPPSALLAVVKANGYGHSATLVAPMLARAGVAWLGVTDAAEGVAVRASLGSHAPKILIMSGPPGDAPSARESAVLAVRHNLTPVVWTPAQLAPIAAAAASTPHPIHLEVDTGMSRQGAAPGPALEAFLQALEAYPNLHLDGVFTHLASAEAANASQTLRQLASFEQAVRTIAASGHKPAWLHLGNASTIDNASPAAAPTLARLIALAVSIGARPLIRCGLALYGLCLPTEPPSQNETRLTPNLQPILHWKTHITSILDIPKGAQVGYSATFIAPYPMRLALLPVGYADGLNRALSSTNAAPGGWVVIAGVRAPVVGRVSMNLTTVDVTHIQPAPQPGDPVTLLGKGVTAEDHARLARTIPYEILCGLRGSFAAT